MGTQREKHEQMEEEMNSMESGYYHQANRKTNKKNLFKKIRWGILIAAAAVIVWILSTGSFYQIGEEEQAVLVTFGKPAAVTETGLHFKFPLIQKVYKVNTTIQGFPVGYSTESNETVESESVMITSDYNFINVDFFVEYRIADPVQYLYGSRQPELVLNNISQSCIRNVIGSYTVDDVLTTGKSEIQTKIKELVIDEIERQNIGLQLVNITMQDSEPPTQEVMQAFKTVETAKQGKETAINNANKYRNEKLPEAEAQVDEIIKNAEAKKQTRINEAEAQVARFNAMYEEYQKNPVITKQRMYFEAMEEVLPGMKIVVDGGNGVEKILPLESFSAGEQETEAKSTDSSASAED